MTASGFFRMDRVNHNVAEGCDPIRDATGTIVDWKKNIYPSHRSGRRMVAPMSPSPTWTVSCGQ